MFQRRTVEIIWHHFFSNLRLCARHFRPGRPLGSSSGRPRLPRGTDRLPMEPLTSTLTLARGPTSARCRLPVQPDGNAIWPTDRQSNRNGLIRQLESLIYRTFPADFSDMSSYRSGGQPIGVYTEAPVKNPAQGLHLSAGHTCRIQRNQGGTDKVGRCAARVGTAPACGYVPAR